MTEEISQARNRVFVKSTVLECLSNLRINNVFGNISIDWCSLNISN